MTIEAAAATISIPAIRSFSAGKSNSKKFRKVVLTQIKKSHILAPSRAKQLVERTTLELGTSKPIDPRGRVCMGDAEQSVFLRAAKRLSARKEAGGPLRTYYGAG